MAERWTAGHIIDETWRYSDEAFERIAEALGIPEDDRDNLRDHLTVHAQQYIAMRANDKGKPKPGQVTDRLKKLQRACEEMVEALDVDDASVERLESVALESGTPAEAGGRLLRLADEVRRLREWAAAAQDTPKGRPPDEARHYFGNRLREIWIAQHGAAPRRVHAEGSEVGQFAHFVRLCVSELPGFEEGKDDFIRDLTTGRRRKNS